MADVLHKIASLLSATQLAQAACLSRAWRQTCDQPTLWQRQAALLGQSPEGPLAKIKRACWRALRAEANLESHRPPSMREVFSSEETSGLRWSKDGLTIALVTYDGSARLFCAATGREVFRSRHVAGGEWHEWDPTCRRWASQMKGPSLVVHDLSGRRLVTHQLAEDVDSFGWAADGQTLMHSHWDLGGVRQTRVICLDPFASFTSDREAAMAASLSPDGRKVLFVGGHLASIWDVFSQQRTFLPGAEDAGDVGFGFGPHPTWSPDSEKIAALLRTSTLKFLDGSTLAEIGQVSNISIDVSPIWSPDSQKIFVLDTRGSALIVEAPTGQPLWRENAGGAVGCVAWSANSRRLALSGPTGLFTIKTLGSDREPWQLTLSQGEYIKAFTWSPDGTEIATITHHPHRETLNILDLAAAGKDEASALQCLIKISRLHLSPPGDT